MYACCLDSSSPILAKALTEHRLSSTYSAVLPTSIQMYALAEDPNNVDAAVALEALQMRGIQMVWYSPEAAATDLAPSFIQA